VDVADDRCSHSVTRSGETANDTLSRASTKGMGVGRWEGASRAFVTTVQTSAYKDLQQRCSSR
jgi:hypothetical protein